MPKNKDEQPFLVHALYKFADYISSTQFANFYDKHLHQCPWMAETMLHMLQRPMSMMARMSCSHEHLMTAMAGKDIDTEEFLDIRAAFHQVLWDLQCCIDNNSPGITFTTPPSSWVPPQPKTPIKTHSGGDSRGGRNRGSDSTPSG
eukprot:8872536-Ditylum_brightwellii.AAC.1